MKYSNWYASNREPELALAGCTAHKSKSESERDIQRTIEQSAQPELSFRTAPKRLHCARKQQIHRLIARDKLAHLHTLILILLARKVSAEKFASLSELLGRQEQFASISVVDFEAEAEAEARLSQSRRALKAH